MNGKDETGLTGRSPAGCGTTYRRVRRKLPSAALSAAFVLLAAQLPVTLAEATVRNVEPAATAAPEASNRKSGPVENGETAEQPSPATAWRPPPMPEPAPFSSVEMDPEQARNLAERWGVKVLGMRLTSAGYMLDFRFRVLDAEKALPLFDHRIKPFVLAEHSQVKLPVPMAAKVGALRPTNRGKNIKPDKNYYMIFGNPDSYLKPGQKVSVVIGDFRAEHLTVQ